MTKIQRLEAVNRTNEDKIMKLNDKIAQSEQETAKAKAIEKSNETQYASKLSEKDQEI